MAKLQDTTRRETKKLILPTSTKDNEVWVEVYTEALAGDVEQMADAGDKRGLAMVTGLVNIIKDWNFEKDDGTKEEISIENVRRISQKDIVFIMSEIQAYNDLAGFDVAQKKNTVTTSSPKLDEKTTPTPTA